MNYIVVGSDCSGKTTLVNALSEITEMKVVKGSSFELSKCSNEELYDKFLEFTVMDNVIFDRFIYCNAVYAPMYKDFAVLNELQKRNIELKMKDKALVIYLTADDEVLTERFKIRGDDYVELENILKTKELYVNELFKVEHLPFIIYDTGEWSTEEIIEDILKNY